MASSVNKHLASFCILLVVHFRSGLLQYEEGFSGEMQTIPSDTDYSLPEDIAAYYEESRPEDYLEGSVPEDGSMIIPNDMQPVIESYPKYLIEIPDDQSDLLPQSNLDPEASEDIWRDPKYTDCISLLRKKEDRWEKNCYPGSNETDDLMFDNGKNCRLVDGKCLKVHRDWEFLRSFFSPPPTYTLPCLMINDECFVMDREKDILLKSGDECYESFCRRLTVDSKNPRGFCFQDCENSQASFEDTSSLEDHMTPGSSQEESAEMEESNEDETSAEQDDSHEYEEKENDTLVPSEEVTSALLQGLKTIVPEHHFQGKPIGLFYSISVLYNDTISAVVSTQNYNRRPDETFDDENESSTVADEGSQNDYQSLYDEWKNPLHTDCFLHQNSKDGESETKCYPGNNKSIEIGIEWEHYCRLIDGLCYKVHENEEFLSSYLAETQNQTLECVKFDDKCFLIENENRLLLYKKEGCNESSCRHLDDDADVSKNSQGDKRSNILHSWIPVQIISNQSASSLLQALEAVVPKTKFDENPSAIIYSVGLLYNNSEPTLSADDSNETGTVNDTDVSSAEVSSGISSGEAVPSTEDLSSVPGESIEESSPTYLPPTGPTEYLVDYDYKHTSSSENAQKPDETANNEYFFSPNSPFVFLGPYPGTTGSNDTLIIHGKSYKHYDGKVPTMQIMYTKIFYFDKNISSHVDKDVIFDIIANFPDKENSTGNNGMKTNRDIRSLKSVLFVQEQDWCDHTNYTSAEAEFDGNLGNAREADCCVRKESCKDVMQPSETKYGLKNDGPYRRFHCRCEYNFLKCLKKTKNIITNSVGVAYFNILAPKCYALEQKMECLSKNEWSKCDKYGYNRNSKEEYQWLDTPTYLV